MAACEDSRPFLPCQSWQSCLPTRLKYSEEYLAGLCCLVWSLLRLFLRGPGHRSSALPQIAEMQQPVRLTMRILRFSKNFPYVHAFAAIVATVLVITARLQHFRNNRSILCRIFLFYCCIIICWHNDANVPIGLENGLNDQVVGMEVVARQHGT